MTASRRERSLMEKATPLIIGRLVSALLTFAIPVVLARHLLPHEYGTYKQFFLVAQTAILIGQLGLPASLYFFVPRGGDDRGRYLVQTLVLLLVLGAAAAGVLLAAAGPIAARFENPAFAALAVPLALYVWATLAAFPLEVALTVNGLTGWAGVTYAISDLARTFALLAPITAGLGLRGLAWAALGLACVRLAGAWILGLSGRLGPPRLPRRATLRHQLGYALPFGAAVLVSVTQMQLPQYLVAALTDAATFAVFAVGALQVPFTDMVYTPVAEVMMVRLAATDACGAPAVFQEACGRLLVFFLPLCAFAWAAAPELIPTLYTARYRAAVPIFAVAASEVMLSALPVDGLLRAMAATRTLFWVGCLRLGFTLVAVPLCLRFLGLPGAMLGYVATQYLAKALLLGAAARRLRVPMSALVPWRPARTWAACGALIFVAVTMLRRGGAWHGWSFLAVAAPAAASVWVGALFLQGELGRRLEVDRARS